MRSMTRRRRREGRRRIVAGALVACAAFAVSVQPAEAHTSTLPDVQYYRSTVTGVVPAVTGLSLTLEPAGESITLTNRTGSIVEVPGYAGEDYLRFMSDGVEENVNSLSAFLNGSLVIEGLPQQQGSNQGPAKWQRVSSTPTYSWHDHRTHWMAQQRPPIVASDPEHPHVVFSWSVPLKVDSRPVTVTGTLSWTGQPRTSPLAYVLYALGATTLAAFLVLLVRLRRTSAGRTAAGGPAPTPSRSATATHEHAP